MIQHNMETNMRETGVSSNGGIIPDGIWWLIGVYVIPCVPEFIKQIIEIPDHIMDKGYSLNITKGDMEIRFGKDNANNA